MRRWDVRGGWYFYFRVRVALVVRGQGASRGVDGWWVVYEGVTVANFDEICKTESIFDRPCLLIIERGRPGTTNCAIRAEEPSSSANREWFDDTDGRFLITPMDALTESFYADLCEALDTHGDRITSLEINGKGPFRIERDTLRVALDAFATRASETKLSALKICHCWLAPNAGARSETFSPARRRSKRSRFTMKTSMKILCAPWRRARTRDGRPI